ncbi:MAG: glycosyltransferase [Candidatus Hydrogenedentes bacterium]|nr:glycosyltransferase [Candidatus Hydrogenedentota bacterium]
MNVLSHGTPFFSSYDCLDRYSGPHEVRTAGNFENAYYRYDPREEDAPALISRISRDWRPGLLLCWMPEIHPPPLHIEEVQIPTVALVSDWNVFYPLLETNLARYDAVLCDTPGVRALKNSLVSPHHLFPLYSQITKFHRPYPEPKDIDVAFVGNLNHTAHSVRARYLERLARLSSRYRIVIATQVHGEDYGRLLSRARIVFNHSIRGELNLRVFETMACGSLALLEEDNLEVRNWFEPARDLVLYNQANFEECIAHYLAHPGEASAIAERGMAKVERFAGENRLTELIDCAATLPSSGRPFRDLAPEERLYQDFTMYAFSQWNVYHAIECELLPHMMRALPNDPRAWTSLGQHLANAYSDAGDDAQRRIRYLKAFAQAQRLAPSSAPCALNLATAARACQLVSQEVDSLNLALLATSLEGPQYLVGSSGYPFLIRWQRAVAEKTATLAMLHAEAHIRMAHVLAGQGEPSHAEEHLAQAGLLDPHNTGGMDLLAELQWVSGRREEAIATLYDGMARQPMNAAPRERLCEMLAETGRDEEARALAEDSMLIARACQPFYP